MLIRRPPFSGRRDKAADRYASRYGRRCASRYLLARQSVATVAGKRLHGEAASAVDARPVASPRRDHYPTEITQWHRLRRPHQRFRAGGAADRGGGVEILSRISRSAACTLVISTASLSTLCRTKSRLAGAAAIISSLVASR